MGIRNEASGRDVSGLHIGIIDGVKLCPQEFALARESSDGLLLLASRMRIPGYKVEREGGVRGRLREPADKVCESARQVGIVKAQLVDAKGDQVARKQFGEGRRDGHQERAFTNQGQICIHGVAYAGKDAAAWNDQVAG
jgi:hypothetical protein